MLIKKELIDPSDLPLNERIKRLKNETEGDSEFFFSDLLFKSRGGKNSTDNVDEENNTQKGLIQNEEDDELKVMMEQHQNNLVKKFSDDCKLYNKILITRKQENEKILENVIDLNNFSKNKNEKEEIKDKNIFFLKGNFPTENSKKIQQAKKSSALIHRYGNFYDSRNSFLHAMKNDKYHVKNDNEEYETEDLEKKRLGKEKILNGFTSAIGGLSKPQSKAMNLSALFLSDRSRHVTKEINENKMSLNKIQNIKSPAKNSVNMFKRLNN